MEATKQDKNQAIENHCRIINEAREKFMKGKISADTYWNIRKTHLQAILDINEK